MTDENGLEDLKRCYLKGLINYEVAIYNVWSYKDSYIEAINTMYEWELIKNNLISDWIDWNGGPIS